MFQQAVINTLGDRKRENKSLKKEFWKFTEIKSNTDDK